MWQSKDQMNVELDSCLKFPFMNHQCFCGWMKVVMIAATQSENMGTGIPLCDQRLHIRGTRYSTIPIISTEGVHDVYITEGNINGERFSHFIEKYLVPVLQEFNGINPKSVVNMDNASIHHV